MKSGFKYFREFWRHPKNMGSVVESGLALSTAMASAMANAVKFGADDVVIELGAGTGAITEQLLRKGVSPHNLMIIEWNERFVEKLKLKFPNVLVVHGDAWDIEDIVDQHFQNRSCKAVLSGLPLLNFQMDRRTALLNAIANVLTDDGVFLQFSYGLKNPVPPTPGLLSASCSKWILKNVPPARVWTYSYGNLSANNA